MHKPRYAWESSVFIAWLKADETAPLFDIDAVVNEIDENEANLIVSVTAYMEVLEAKHPAEQMNLFRQFLKRSNVTVVDNTVNIAEKTGSIRSKAVDAGRKMDTADATFVATAILYEADMLHIPWTLIYSNSTRALLWTDCASALCERRAANVRCLGNASSNARAKFNLLSDLPAVKLYHYQKAGGGSGFRAWFKRGWHALSLRRACLPQPHALRRLRACHPETSLFEPCRIPILIPF